MTKKEIMEAVKMLSSANRRDLKRYTDEISARIDALIESVPVPDRQTCNAYYCAKFAVWREGQK